MTNEYYKENITKKVHEFVRTCIDKRNDSRVILRRLKVKVGGASESKQTAFSPPTTIPGHDYDEKC
jgi:hypothetical protein